MAHEEAPNFTAYDRKVVRDLLWVLTSPHVIDRDIIPVFPLDLGLATLRDGADWLRQLEADPSDLIAFLQGNYYPRQDG